MRAIHAYTHTLCLAVAELKAEAVRIETGMELECQNNAREAEIQFLREQNELEIGKAKQLGSIEVRRSWECSTCIIHVCTQQITAYGVTK